MKLYAILGGGDWYDASIDHIVLPDGVDLEAEKKRRDEWYRMVYVPHLRAGGKPEHQTFPQWLLKNVPGARRATEDDVIEFWD